MIPEALQTFVTNMVQPLQKYTSANQWSYTLSEDNPVDDASRGMIYFSIFFRTSLGGFRVQDFYVNHNQIGRGLQLKKQIKI